MTVLPGVLGALRCRAYRHFTIGNVPSLLGQWAQRTALAWLMWRMTRSGTWIGALAFVELAPMVLLSPLTGVLADRWRYLRVMRAVQLLLAGQALALFALARRWPSSPTRWPRCCSALPCICCATPRLRGPRHPSPWAACSATGCAMPFRIPGCG